MNLQILIRHCFTDAAEIAGKAARGEFSRAVSAARTHGTNAAILVAERTGKRGRVHCPCCQWSGYRFRTIDAEGGVFDDVECPACGSHERHRLLHVYLERGGLPFLRAEARVLHVAPEPNLRDEMAKWPGLVVFSTDIAPDKLRPVQNAKFRGDLQRLPLRSELFDGIFCLHVLEHVPDDRAAIVELHRTLKKDGQALIMVPMGMHLEKTVEFDPAGPLLYGHLRDYAPHDMAQRLAPFSVETVRAEDVLTEDEMTQFGAPGKEIIFICRK